MSNSVSPNQALYLVESDQCPNRFQRLSTVDISKERVLALNAPNATKVVCFSSLLKCLRSLYGKHC